MKLRMRIPVISLCLLTAFVCASGMAIMTEAEQQVDPLQFDIKTGHPILLVNPEILSEARTKEAALNDFIDNKAKKFYIKASSLNIPLIRSHVDVWTEGGRHEGYYVGHLALPVGLYALLTEDPIGIEYARQTLLSFIAMGPEWHGPGDGHVTGRLFAMGLLYDWVYSDLSTETRRQVREYLLDTLALLDDETKTSLLNPVTFTGGHAHYAHIYALAALLAIGHDIHLDSEQRQQQYSYFLEKVVSNWVNGYIPVLAWVSEGGGHHMGWDYSQGYTRSMPFLLWEYGTNEPSWLASWQNERPFFYLYGLRALKRGRYSQFPVHGDASGVNWNPARSGLEAAVAASHYQNPYAAWLVETLGTNHLARLLYLPTNGPAPAPPDTLPLGRHFQNSGYTIMRDSWESALNTLVVFKSSPFYSFNHHHRDENAFTIFYRGPLAIDSGVYSAGGAYGSEHWYNYYTRSIAHNTILIYDPDERVRGLKGAVVSRDGGQKLLVNTEPTLLQMLPGGKHSFDGILRFENHPDYAYSVGDATKAYDPGKMSLFRRSLIYLRDHSYDHPLILVHDRVISTRAELKKTYLLHTINKPRIINNVATIALTALPNPMVGLHQETVLPKNSQISMVGGRNNAQDFYVLDNGLGAPQNFSAGVRYKDQQERMQQGLLEGGQWRVEVSPGSAALEDTFLNAISIVDEPGVNGRANIQYVHSQKLDGLVINDADGQERTLALLQKISGPLDENIDLSGRNDFDKVLIVGLEPNDRYSIGRTHERLVIKTETGASFGSSDAGTIYVDAIEISGL
jgi:hypothetical protein